MLIFKNDEKQSHTFFYDHACFDRMTTHPILNHLTPEQHAQMDAGDTHSVIVANMEGHVMACNAGAGKLFSYTQKEMLGSHVRVFHPPQNFAKILPDLFRTAMSKGKYDNVITLIDKHGKEFLAHIIVTAIHDENKTIVGLMGVTTRASAKRELSFIQKWHTALRAPFFAATIVPVLLGSAIGFYHTSEFLFWPFFFTIIGMIFIHAGVNLANDYFDHKSGNDELNQNPTPFSGGSRVIQEGIIPAHHIKWAFLVCLSIGAAIGLYLNTLHEGNVILMIGLLGMAIGVFYSAPPFAASYRKWGEAFVAVGFGPLIVLGSYYTQAGVMNILPLAASVPMAIMIMLVLFLNQFPDFEADKKALKRNWVNTLGKQKSVKVMRAFLIFAYAFTFAMIVWNIFPAYTAFVFLTIPHAYITYDIAKKNYDKILELLPANAEMITLNFLFGVLLTSAFVLLAWQGA